MGDSNFWELDARMLGQQEITTLTASCELFLETHAQHTSQNGKFNANVCVVCHVDAYAPEARTCALLHQASTHGSSCKNFLATIRVINMKK